MCVPREVDLAQRTVTVQLQEYSISQSKKEGLSFPENASLCPLNHFVENSLGSRGGLILRILMLYPGKA